MSLPVFVINLDRRPDRLDRMAAQLDGLGVGWERVPGLDAQTAADTDLLPRVAVSDHRLFTRRGSQCLARTNLAIFDRMAVEQIEAAIVLQDDVELAADFAPLAADDAWVPPEHGLVQMEQWRASGRRLTGPPRGTPVPGRAVHALYDRAMGAACFLIRGWAAGIVAHHPGPVDVPGDHWLFNPAVSPFFRRVRPAILLPAIARQREAARQSDISGAASAPRPRGQKLKKKLTNLTTLPWQGAQLLRHGARPRRSEYRP